MIYEGINMMVNRYSKQRNCFNLIRLITALTVFYGHGKEHLQISNTCGFLDVISKWIPGVPVFFFLSGMLIWKSIDNSKDCKEYIRKRVFRIYPELWVAVIISLISIIVLYNADIQWGLLGLFGITQATFLQFWTPNFLRGFGCGTPNGSLWTIAVTLQFYIFVWFAYKKLKGKGLGTWVAVMLLSLALGAIKNISPALLPEIADKLLSQTLVPYLWIFLLGCFASEFFNQIILIFTEYWFVWLALSFVWTYQIPFDVRIGKYLLIKNALFFSVCLGIGYKFPKLNINPDISYGFYIYHMIVINIMIELGLIGSMGKLGIALTISLVCAYISTKTIGKYGVINKLFIRTNEVKT